MNLAIDFADYATDPFSGVEDKSGYEPGYCLRPQPQHSFPQGMNSSGQSQDTA
jgi:hypothetical protein